MASASDIFGNLIVPVLVSSDNVELPVFVHVPEFFRLIVPALL
ncbi:hypothetical protein SALWKB12_0447 [Snodgrassella communis]|nr:hypothetical protein SALWKB12_0447 [Snodgrassella communis]